MRKRLSAFIAVLMILALFSTLVYAGEPGAAGERELVSAEEEMTGTEEAAPGETGPEETLTGEAGTEEMSGTGGVAEAAEEAGTTEPTAEETPAAETAGTTEPEPEETDAAETAGTESAAVEEPVPMAAPTETETLFTAFSGTEFSPEGDPLTYVIIDGTEKTAAVCGGGSGLTSITIPETVSYEGETYTVTEVEKDAFKGYTSLESLSISGTVKTIGTSAFSNCINLTEIHFASDSQLVTIKAEAFAYMGKDDETVPAVISSLTFPASLETVEDGAFHCIPVRQFALEDGSRLKEIPCGFLSADGLDGCPGEGTENGNFEDKIHNFIFKESSFTPKKAALACACLESVDFGDENHLERICRGAFKNQTCLTSIDFGENSEASELVIYEGAFAAAGNNGYLAEQGIDASVNNGIDTLVFPANLKTLENGCFRFARVKNLVFRDGCKLEKTGTLLMVEGSDGMPGAGSSVEGLSQAVLMGACSLETVRFGAGTGLTEISSGAFKNQAHLTLIDFGSPSGELTICNGAFAGAGNNGYLMEQGIETELNPGIDRLVFPSNLKTIESGAFRFARIKNLEFAKNCKLESLPYAFLTIDGVDAMPGTGYNVTNNNLSEAVLRAANSLETISFGENNSLTKINGGALKNQSHLTKIDFGSSNVSGLTLESGVFIGAGNNGYLLEQGFDDALNDGIEILTLPASLKQMNEGAFRFARIKNLVFSDGCKLASTGYGFLTVDGADGTPGHGNQWTNIEQSQAVINAANSLESVTFGENNSLSSINSGSFKNQSHLAKIDFGTSSADYLCIQGGAFAGAGNNGYLVSQGIEAELNDGIDTLTLPANLTGLEYGSFRLSRVKNVEFSDSCKLTSTGSFMAVEGSDSMPGIAEDETIPQKVYEGASSLETIKLGENNNFENIGAGAFKNQSHLKEIDFGSSNKDLTIGAGAFLGAGDNDYLMETGADSSRNEGMDTLTIPANVTSFSGGNFRYTRAEQLVFEDGSKLEKLDNGAFSDCDELTTADLRGSSIKTIGDALKEDPKLKRVYFPETLEAITWKDTDEEEERPFYNSGAVKELHFASTDPSKLTFTDDVLKPLNKSGIVFVPADTPDEALAEYEEKLTGAGLTFGNKNWRLRKEHAHTLEKTEAVDPTCTEEGNSAYWTCTYCGLYFSDAEGTKDIEEDSWVLAPKGHSWGEWTVTKEPTGYSEGVETRVCKNDPAHKETRPIARVYAVKYTNTAGSGSVWTKNKDIVNLTYGFRRSAENEKTLGLFKELQLDGKVVAAANYTASAGTNGQGINILLKRDYLKTLANGSHTVTAVFKDTDAENKNLGASGTLTIKEDPATVTITATKVWEDEDNADGFRPDAKAFASYLYVEDQKFRQPDATPEIRDNGDGTYTITYRNLPVMVNWIKADYFVNELPITAYETRKNWSNGKETIINTRTETVDIKSGHTYILLSAKDQSFALDIAGGACTAGANAHIYKSNGTEAQAFTLTKQSDGTWELLNYKGMALDVKGASKENGANVQTYTPNGSAAQRFRIRDNGDGTVTFINKNSGLALDIQGGKMKNKQNVQQYKSNGTASQKWILADVTDQMEKLYPKTYEGTYTITSALGKSWALEVKDASKAKKANVQLGKSGNAKSQTFTLTYRGGGFYSITNGNSGRVLDVKGGKVKNKQNVWQYSWNGSAAQLWKVTRSGGNVVIHSALNDDFVLDVKGGKAAAGSNVQIYRANGTKAQKWKLKEA